MEALTAAHIEELLQQEIDWITLFKVALRHGMMPLLYWHLNNLCPQAVPTDFLRRLRNAFYTNAANNLLLADELLKLLNLFEAHELPAIPFKGPTLAALVYGNLAFRQFVDLDLLVHARDFARASQLLLAQGFRLMRGYGWESSFVDENKRVCIDLHYNIVPPYIPFPIDFEHLWEHRATGSIANTMVPTLSVEHTLLFLCVQAAKDAWDNCLTLAKICDIVELLHVHPQMDWTRVMQEASGLRGQRLLLFGLCLASMLLDTALPQEVVQVIAVHPSVNTLVVRTVQSLFCEAGHRYSVPWTFYRLAHRFRFHCEVRESLRDKCLPFLYYPLSLPKICGWMEKARGRYCQLWANRTQDTGMNIFDRIRSWLRRLDRNTLVVKPQPGEGNPLWEYFSHNPGRLIDKWHHYFDIYHNHFRRYRGQPVRLLEIGVSHGGSLQMWKKYFGPKAKIYGVDINPRCKELEEDQIEIIIGDQSDRAFLKELREKVAPLDIVIDDGGHTMLQQINTFEELFPAVREKGIYLVEDLHTSYWKEYGGGYKESGSFIEYAKGFIDSINAWHSREPELAPNDLTKSVTGIHFYDSVLVLEKYPSPATQDFHDRQAIN